MSSLNSPNISQSKDTDSHPVGHLQIQLLYIHIPCNTLIIRYLIQLFAQSVISIYLSRSSYIFPRIQGHYNGGIYKGRQVQQILSKMRTSLTEIALLLCLCIFLPDDDTVEVETYRRNKSNK
jgi:hypothetical protein